MDFDLTKSQKEIQKAAAEFAKGEFDKDLIIEHLHRQAFPEKICRKAADLGFIGINFPEKFEGGGMGLFEYILVAEQFCKRDSSMGMAVLLSAHGGECLFTSGENSVSGKYLFKIAVGETRCAAAFFETGFGRKLTHIETTAVKHNGGWCINGKKAYVPNGLAADVFFVLCRAESGMSLFAIEANTPGVQVKPSGMQLGERLTPYADVTFDNVCVPGDFLIGKPGKGLEQANSFLTLFRVQLAGIALGTAQGALDRALDHVRKRVQFGKKIGQFQVIRHKIAEMAAGIDAARSLTYLAAWKSDNRRLDEKTAAAAKLLSCRTAMAVTDEAVQLLGGYGYMTEYEVEHFYRDAKVLEVMGGTCGELLDIISGPVIGRIK